MKLLLLLFIINLLLNRKPTGYLYCGLFGWVGSNPSTFSRHAFSILGISNESRGGDSCGIYSNRAVRYGTGYSRDFPTFVKKNDHIRAGKDCVVMGHTRKASIGSVVARNAQPVALKDKEGELGIVLTHNGTLSNYEELAEKYDLDISNLNTDSQVLAALMYYTAAGSTILGEYNGTATVVYHLPGTNSIYIFKGRSKSSSNFQHTTEERPLYGYQESAHSFYYSSLRAPLEVIAKNEKDIFDIKCNSLIKITGGTIESMTEIDRSEQYQRYVEPYVYKKPKTTSMGYAYGDAYGYNDADFYGESTYDRTYPKKKNLSYDKLIHHSPHIAILSETFATMGDEMVNYTKGRYHLGQNCVHGKVTVNDYGLVINIKTWTKPYHTLYFWEGILLYGEGQYHDLERLKRTINQISTRHMSLLEASPYPIATYDTDPISKDFKLYANDDVTSRPDTFTGRFVPIFCNKIYTVREGLLVCTNNQSTLNKLTEEKMESLKTWA